MLAINDHEFLVLERDNRTMLANPPTTPGLKRIYKIDLLKNGLNDVSDGVSLPDGRLVLYVLTDNDLNPAIPTQIYAFAVYAAQAGISFQAQQLPAPLFPPGRGKNQQHDHSSLITASGSMRVARRAGRVHAAIA